ncbi:fusion protein [Hipposideros bat paramyxovirus]|nr:fusion protein [Hipposideros bat paramyxovirus]
MAERRYLIILILSVLISEVRPQVAISELSKIGVIKARNYGLKIKGNPSYQFMVIKFIPTITLNDNAKCNFTAVDEYKIMLERILTPINKSLEIMKSTITSRTTGVRFWGAVIGGVALGVATAAQITAGIALHNSIKNAAAIQGLTSAILKSNKAIEKLTLSSQKTVLAISGLQDQINTNIIPAIEKLGCETAHNTLRLHLNRYFSETSLVFGPNLRDPSTEAVSIQALSQAFGGDFDSLLTQLGYTKQDFLDVLQSDSIVGRIIDVDVPNALMTLQIEYPEMTDIPDAVVQEFNLISYNYKGLEWMSLFPRHILIRGNFLSNIDLTDCSRTDNNYICREDTSSPLSNSMYKCATGSLPDCARVQVVNSHVPRYALSDGVVFANCLPITCVCTSKSQHIIQDNKASNVMITSEFCKEIQIDGIYITVGPRLLNRTYYGANISVGPPITTNPVDVSNQLAQVENELNEAKKYLDQSNNIINNIKHSILTPQTMVYLVIISVFLILWFIITLIWLIKLTRNQGNSDHFRQSLERGSTINSLSSLIPGT